MSATSQQPDQATHETATDAREQIAELRRKVEGLLAERAGQATHVVDRAEMYAGDVAEKAQRGYDDLQERVRGRPATSLLIAAAVGFVLARILGR